MELDWDEMTVLQKYNRIIDGLTDLKSSCNSIEASILQRDIDQIRKHVQTISATNDLLLEYYI